MIDTRIVRDLKAIESVAVIPRVASTNLIARRIVTECIENELSLPQAVIIAGEQFAGRGRNDRRWSSPPGKGIYATALVTRPVSELPLVPMAMAAFIASWLRGEYGIDARIKWPNDVLADQMLVAETAGAFGVGRIDALGAEDVRRAGPLIVRCRRARAAPGPAPGYLVLLTDAGFVLEPDLYAGARALVARDLLHEDGEVF